MTFFIRQCPMSDGYFDLCIVMKIFSTTNLAVNHFFIKTTATWWNNGCIQQAVWDMTKFSQVKVQLGWKFPLKTLLTVTRRNCFFFCEWQENFWNDLFSAKLFNVIEGFFNYTENLTKYLLTGNVWKIPFQFVHYLICISNIKKIELREESFV